MGLASAFFSSACCAERLNKVLRDDDKEEVGDSGDGSSFCSSLSASSLSFAGLKIGCSVLSLVLSALCQRFICSDVGTEAIESTADFVASNPKSFKTAILNSVLNL